MVYDSLLFKCVMDGIANYWSGIEKAKNAGLIIFHEDPKSLAESDQFFHASPDGKTRFDSRNSFGEIDRTFLRILDLIGPELESVGSVGAGAGNEIANVQRYLERTGKKGVRMYGTGLVPVNPYLRPDFEIDIDDRYTFSYYLSTHDGKTFDHASGWTYEELLEIERKNNCTLFEKRTEPFIHFQDSGRFGSFRPSIQCTALYDCAGAFDATMRNLFDSVLRNDRMEQRGKMINFLAGMMKDNGCFFWRGSQFYQSNDDKLYAEASPESRLIAGKEGILFMKRECQIAKLLHRYSDKIGQVLSRQNKCIDELITTLHKIVQKTS